ncbi:C-C motif chemokine 36.1 [Halichoeres trimaculatus]|uniref:C-C motif chemokine 36.1 n=1 Tax=Halichoeres trimaculatus TaxID=147232 RepID=UPI003D9E5879
MESTRVLLLCMLGAALFCFAFCHNGDGPENCCFQFYPRRVKKDLISSYYSTDSRCAKSGVILVTQKSRNICADPNLSWVIGIMKMVDERTF